MNRNTDEMTQEKQWYQNLHKNSVKQMQKKNHQKQFWANRRAILFKNDGENWGQKH